MNLFEVGDTLINTAFIARIYYDDCELVLVMHDGYKRYIRYNTPLEAKKAYENIRMLRRLDSNVV